MTALMYEISLPMLKNIFQHLKRNSVSPCSHIISYVYVLAGTCRCLGLHWFLQSKPSFAKRRTLMSLKQNHNPNFWYVQSLLETDLLNSLPSGETEEIIGLRMWWQDLYFTQESIDKWWISDLKWYLLKHGFKTETTLCKPENEKGNQSRAQIAWISHRQRLPPTLYLSALNSDSLYIAIILFDKRNTFTVNIPWAVFSGSEVKKSISSKIMTGNNRSNFWYVTCVSILHQRRNSHYMHVSVLKQRKFML